MRSITMVVLSLALAACDPGSLADAGDTGADAADGDGDADLDAETDSDEDDPGADADHDAPAGEPWSYAGEEVALSVHDVGCSAERLCDLDGDGREDNAFAELGAGTSALAASVYSGLLANISTTGTGLGWVLPARSEAGPPGLILVAGQGAQRGGELWAPPLGLDECGEPRTVFEEATVEEGDLLGTSGHGLASIPLGPDLLPAREGRLSGQLLEGPAGLIAQLSWCFYVTIFDAGAARGPALAGELSLLEVLLRGGEVFGAPSVPGIQPDIDVDHDGLESFETDAEGRITRCIDGDRTVVDGADCWMDPRVADAFSLVVDMEATGAGFDGRGPGWAGCCGDSAYPDPSRFGPPWTVPGRARQLITGSSHTCSLTEDGAVRCWGFNEDGELGCGTIDHIGDDEPASDGCVVDLGGRAIQLAAGGRHTCAILEGGRVRCWGGNGQGQLGYGHTSKIGDDETPSSAGDVDLGGVAIQIAAAAASTCAVLEGGSLRCWGASVYGQLGYGDTESIGDDETPATAGDVDVGGAVRRVAMGPGHTCALLEDGRLLCWGTGAEGQLGYGDVEDIGDDETPGSVGAVDVGGSVVRVSAGRSNTCVLRTDGEVLCWGDAARGQLGTLGVDRIGDDETPASAGTVDVGGTVLDVVVGNNHACVLLDGGAVRCWGQADHGALGYGTLDDVGDDETPAAAGDVDVGGAVESLAAGKFYTCALLATGSVRCWGVGESGNLGHGDISDIGDDETPASIGDVPIFDCGD